jgi:hypothetical protein
MVLLYIVACKLLRLADNPLVVYELSATIFLIRPPLSGFGWYM